MEGRSRQVEFQRLQTPREVHGTVRGEHPSRATSCCRVKGDAQGNRSPGVPRCTGPSCLARIPRSRAGRPTINLVRRFRVVWGSYSRWSAPYLHQSFRVITGPLFEISPLWKTPQARKWGDCRYSAKNLSGCRTQMREYVVFTADRYHRGFG